MLTRQQQIEKTKRIMDIIVYASSAIDMVIAILVMFSYFKVGNPAEFLLPVNYALSLTVVLTVVLGGLLMYLKHYETVLDRLLHISNHVKYRLLSFHRLAIAIARLKPSRYRKFLSRHSQ